MPHCHSTSGNISPGSWNCKTKGKATSRSNRRSRKPSPTLSPIPPPVELAWIVEKFEAWTNPAALPEDAVDLDQLLTNVTLYWFTDSGTTAANFIYESSHADRDWSATSPAPIGFAVFNADDSIRQMLNPDGALPHWSEFEAGGHFPAMEVPDLYIEDIRAYFRKFR